MGPEIIDEPPKMSDRPALRARMNLSRIDAYYIVEYLAKNQKRLLGYLPIKTDRP